jgi:hypothetical protein
MTRTPFVIAAGLFLALPAIAPAGELYHREKKQEHRIDQAEKKGQLSTKEAGKIDAKEAAIESERKEAMKDGKMSESERKSIRHEQKEANQEIYRMRHNKPHGTKENAAQETTK